MKTLKMSKELKKFIELNYELFEANSPEEFIEGLNNDNVDNYSILTEALLQVGAVTEETWDYIQKASDLGCPRSKICLGNEYEYGLLFGKCDFKKAEKLFKEVADEGILAGKYRLGFLYAYNKEFIDKKEEGLKMLNEIASTNNGAMNFSLAQNAEEAGDYELAIKALENAKMVISEPKRDYTDDIDENGIMKLFYPDLSRLYNLIGDEEKANYYLEEGLKANIPDAILLKGDLLLEEKRYDEAKDIYESQLKTSLGRAAYGLAMLFMTKEYHGYDLKLAYHYAKESAKEGFYNGEKLLWLLEATMEAHEAKFKSSC